MRTLTILQETHGEADVSGLDESWRLASTFVFLPEKTSIGSDWLRRAIDVLPADLRENHFALLTSGSTGEPKLVVGLRRRAEALAQVLHEVQQSEPVRETIVALPLSYSFAFVNQWLWSRTAARRLVLTDGFRNPEALRSALHDARDAMLCLVGSQLPLFDTLVGDDAFEGVVRLHFAGGRFPQEQLPALRVRFPNAAVFNNYGCAEALPRLTVRRAEDGAMAADVGTPISGVFLQSDAGGALRFQSRFGAVAVVERGALTRIQPEDWVATGDVGHQGDDGHWILEGRASDVFKRHGEKVSAAAVITSVNRHWKGTAATYRDIDRMGEPGFVLVLSPPPTQSETAEVLRMLRESYPRAHWPLRIESTVGIPLLANGKPDTAALSAAADLTTHWRQRI